MSENAPERGEEHCRVCCEPMGDEGGHTHIDCYEAAKEEFEWYQ